MRIHNLLLLYITYLMIGLGATMTTGCSKDEPEEQQSQPLSIVGTWQLTSISAPDYSGTANYKYLFVFKEEGIFQIYDEEDGGWIETNARYSYNASSKLLTLTYESDSPETAEVITLTNTILVLRFSTETLTFKRSAT